jgi:L-ascorbate metabolism protein UlaG (beta-lactamase superfamily)
VITTTAGAERLGGNVIGLEPWQTVDLAASGGRALRITATPARHGPAGGDRGPCIGFALAFADAPDRVVYVAGDTVMYEGVADVARRFHVEVAILFCGAAKVAVAGPSHLTMTAEEGVEAARLFKDATIVPLHFEGWQHFSEPRERIVEAFAAAAMTDRLRLLAHGEKIEL